MQVKGSLVLNRELGTLTTVDDRSCVITPAGKSGIVLYGPYEPLGPGRYAVEFYLSRQDSEPADQQACCAILDVATDNGNSIKVRKEISLSDLDGGRSAFVVHFALEKTAAVEYRVMVTGQASLVIEQHRPLVRLRGDHADVEQLLAARRFPEADGETVEFFRTHRAQLRNLYERDFGIQILDGSVVISAAAFSIYARCQDDIRFIGELLFENVYNLKTDARLTIIDIGLNVGLSSLIFAGKPEVVDVHSFEPFTSTFDRAVANFGLNPDLKRKVRLHNFGLSDRNWEGEITVSQTTDSGAMSTISVDKGIAIPVILRDAATELRPIILRARTEGRQVVLKVDCEGSEFAVFESLRAGGLLPMVAAFMVEWHAMFAGKSQADLIEPLRRAGFIVFDRSPPRGNGFFYAVRLDGSSDLGWVRRLTRWTGGLIQRRG